MLQVIRINEIARTLLRPFVMEQIARVDHFGIFMYLCQGFVQRHQHTIQDELFYVYRGTLVMDTDWGKAVLRDHELTVIPRGLNHSSGTQIPTAILFAHATSDPERRNGHGRITSDDDRHSLPTHAIAEEAANLTQPYLPLPVGQIDEMSLRLALCQGATPWCRHDQHDTLLWVFRGTVNVLADLGPVRLHQDEMVVVPRGSSHRLHASEDALVLSLIHAHITPEEQMGFGRTR